MKNLIGAVIFIAGVFLSYRYDLIGLSGTRDLGPDAPEGALEYFETSDGKSSLTLFEDRLEMEGEMVVGGEVMTMKISDVRSCRRKVGNRFHIESRDGAWIDIDLGLFGRFAANDFEQTIKELIEESRAQSS